MTPPPRAVGRRPLPRLSARLSMVAGLVLQGRPLLDVGCDHGRLPVRLLVDGRVPQAFAGDRLPQAVAATQAAAQDAGVAGRLVARVGDGFAPFVGVAATSNAPATIVLAGLNGDTLRDILATDDAQAVAAHAQRLVIQANRGMGPLRRWLAQRGWWPVAADLVQERGRGYAAVAVERTAPPAAGADGAVSSDDVDERMAVHVAYPAHLPAATVWDVGPLLWRDGHPLLADALRARAARHREAAREIAAAASPASPASPASAGTTAAARGEGSASEPDEAAEAGRRHGPGERAGTSRRRHLEQANRFDELVADLQRRNRGTGQRRSESWTNPR